VCKLQLFIFLFVENLFSQTGVQIGSHAKSISHSCVQNAHVHVQKYKHYSCYIRSILNNSILMIISYDQSWATATLKIASLPLFAGNNSDATPPVSEKNSSVLSLPLRLVNFLKFVLFCRSRVYFSFTLKCFF